MADRTDSVDSLSELLSWRAPFELPVIGGSAGENILLPETVMMVFGGAKTWKSMLAIHTQFSISSGAEWLGFKTSKSTVFKYQVELPKAIDRKRIEKYLNSHRQSNVYFKTATYSKLDTGYGKQSLEADIKLVQSRSPGNHVVVILDPVYMLVSGDISNNKDVMRFLENISELKSKLHVTFIIVHHTHKTRVDSSGNIIDLGSEEVMGSSYWPDYVDTMARVKLLNPFAGKNLVEVSFPLHRHAEIVLPQIQMRWSRYDLHPTVVKRETPEENEEEMVEIPSIRGLDFDNTNKK